MSILKIHEFDVVKLKNGKIGTIQYIHNKDIQPQGYEFQDEKTDEILTITDVDIEETFVQGANVYLKKPNDFNTLRKTLEAVITTNWQYQTSGLNRDNFILSL